MIPIIEIDLDGDLNTLYTDEVDLLAIGELVDVERASDVVFDQRYQVWEVISMHGKTLASGFKSRKAAIEAEIKLMQPGGKLHRKDV
jgi:tRNA splicing endonuclease